ncbi:MAG: hypothetical protein IMZ58_05355 [Thermoplasmata archaeon]|nr:hypothetical protein [Thermoplasmata archaeon]
MKEIHHKKILKEVGVLLLAAIMIFSTIAMAVNTSNESSKIIPAGNGSSDTIRRDASVLLFFIKI